VHINSGILQTNFKVCHYKIRLVHTIDYEQRGVGVLGQDTEHHISFEYLDKLLLLPYNRSLIRTIDRQLQTIETYFRH